MKVLLSNSFLLADVMFNDAIFLSVISVIVLIMVGIIGFFIKQWIALTNERETKALQLFDQVNASLSQLNVTLTKVNVNLEVYEATMDGIINNIESTLKTNVDTVENHTRCIQDHEIRLTVIERTKPHESTAGR